jgi:hypothetical protein
MMESVDEIVTGVRRVRHFPVVLRISQNLACLGDLLERNTPAMRVAQFSYPISVQSMEMRVIILCPTFLRTLVAVTRLLPDPCCFKV